MRTHLDRFLDETAAATDGVGVPRFSGGRMRVIATIEDPRIVRRILTHLGLPDGERLPAGLADP